MIFLYLYSVDTNIKNCYPLCFPINSKYQRSCKLHSCLPWVENSVLQPSPGEVWMFLLSHMNPLEDKPILLFLLSNPSYSKWWFLIHSILRESVQDVMLRHFEAQFVNEMWRASSSLLMPVFWEPWQQNSAASFLSPLEKGVALSSGASWVENSEIEAVCHVVHWIPQIPTWDIFENKFLCQMKRNLFLKCCCSWRELSTSRSCHFAGFIISLIAIQQAIWDSKRKAGAL